MIDNLLRRLATRRRTRNLNTMIRHAPGQTVRDDLMAIAARTNREPVIHHTPNPRVHPEATGRHPPRMHLDRTDRTTAKVELAAVRDISR